MEIDFKFSKIQQQFLNSPKEGAYLLTGEFGSGKTTAAISWMRSQAEKPSRHLSSLLVMAPQRKLLEPYYQAVDKYRRTFRREVMLLSFSSLVQRCVNLFWPLISGQAGFAKPNDPPHFLTIETSQYYLNELISLWLDAGMFQNVLIPRPRLYAQLIDNLNKSAIVPFDYRKTASRLSDAWTGAAEQKSIYADVQKCLNRFREYCLQNNLLDYSLQVELFHKILWPEPLFKRYLKNLYSDLVYDNLEEEPPLVHDLLIEWLPDLDSACLLIDQHGGYRKFLGADPASADRLNSKVSHKFVFENSCVNSSELLTFRKYFLTGKKINLPDPGKSFHLPDPVPAFVPELLDWTAEKVVGLVEAGIQPSEIAILSPYLSSTFALAMRVRLEALGIACQVEKASALLGDDPVVRLFTGLYIFYLNRPNLAVYCDELTDIFELAFGCSNRVTARLLALQVTGQQPYIQALPDADFFDQGVLERLPAKLIAQYTALRYWLQAQTESIDFGRFVSKAFGEILSQTGYGLSANVAAAEKAALLIESYRKFTLGLGQENEPIAMSIAYLSMLKEGMLSALSTLPVIEETKKAVLITPVLNFIMRNQAVDHQFWMNTGSNGWNERLEQPLTQAYVLSREWKAGQVWTSEDESRLKRETLRKILNGLISRCRKEIWLGISEYDESGNTQRGDLLQAMYGMFKHYLEQSHA